ncbi:hypothetical protein [Pelistega ratti]|uniref:hypothetical protein n=1 Tax=Pelistega ratti TaxID=2652177 RepID=UPI00135C9B6F|nr:hypothetical protein [Pelistega ratti]
MSVTLKVLSAKKVIANHNINQGEVLVIDARANSNYQLIDDATGFGPQNIIAKREGKDLKIFLEDGNLNADIVIQGYYGDDQNEEVSNLLVGQHENGNIYAYVPESGEKLDAVSMLADEVAAPQALGGEDLGSAFWAFNPWWLLALVPIAGIIAAASSGGSGGSGGSGNNNTDTTADKPEITANNDGSVTVKPGADNTKVDVTFKGEDGTDKTVTAEKGSDGKWTIPDAGDTGATVNPDTGEITIPATSVKDGEPVNAKGTDDKGNTADAEAVPAGNNPDTKIPGDSNGDGKVDGDDDSTNNVTLPNGKEIPRNTDGAPNIVFGEDENSDGYINAKEIIGKDDKDTTPVYITIPDKTEVGDILVVIVNGQEQSIPVTPEMIEKGFTQVDVPVTGDGKIEVTAKVTDPAGQSSNEGKESVEVDTGVPGDTDGDGTPSNGDDSKDKVDVPVIDNDGNESTIKVDKNNNGAPNIIFTEDRNGDDFLNKTEIGDDNSTPVQITIPDNTKAGDTLVVTVNGQEQSIPVTDEMINKGYTTVPVEVTKDGDITVTAKVVDKAGNESATATEKVTVDITSPAAPTVTPSETNGSVEVTPPTEADTAKVEITYTDENDQPQTITVTKGDDGQWKADGDVPNGTVVDPATGKVTIPQDNVKDGSEVVAKATDTTGNTGDEGKGDAGPDSKDAAVDNTNGDGVVSTTPADEGQNIVTTVKLTNNNGVDNLPFSLPSGTENGQLGESDFADKSEFVFSNGVTQNPDGTLNVPAGVTEFTITTPVKADATTEGAEKGKFTVGGVEGNEVTVNDTSATPADPADAPTVTPSTTDGSVTVKPGDDNTKVVVEFKDEDGNPVTVTLTKQPDGTWTSDNPTYTPSADGSITIPQDNVKDGSEVVAKATDTTGNTGDEGKGDAGPDSKDAAVDNTNGDGVVSTTPADEGQNIVTTVKLTNNNGVDNLPFSLPNGTATGELGENDFDKPTFSNGVTQNPDGTLNVPAGVTEFTITTPVKADKTTEGEEKGKFTVGNVEGNEVTVNDTSATPADPADAPTVTPSTTDGSVTVKPGDDNTKVVVEFKNEDGNPVTVTLTKQPDGTWTSDNPTYTPSADGSITIPQDNVKDGEPVKATGTNDAGESADDSKNAGPDSKDAAVDNTNGDGVVSTTPADEGQNIVTTVKLTNNNGVASLAFSLPSGTENGQLGESDFADKSEFEFSNGVTQNPDGTLSVPAGVTEFTITTPVKADATTEGAEKGKFTVGGVEGNEVTVNDTSATPVEPADAPVVTPSTTDGSVTVKPGDDNTKVVVEFKDEDGNPVTVTLTKQPDGTWTSDNSAYTPEADGSITIPQDNVKDGEPVKATGTNDAGESADDSKNAGPDSKDAAVDNTNGDGVVSTTPADEGQNIVTTVKLTNNNGVASLPFSLPSGTENGQLGESDFADKSEFEFSNGVTQNSDGTLNVPAGVTEFTITTPVKADATTEGAEKGKFTVGGVEGNEVTVNDTSLAPQNAQIDITQIAGDSQAADVTDDGTSAGDVYAQISPAEAAGGFLISGTSKDITGEITVTIAEKGSNAVVTKTVTPKEDGTWSVNIEADALTGYDTTKEYEVKATGSSADGTAVEDIDLTASTPQVTAIKLKDNLTDEPLVDGTYEYTNYYADGDAKYVGDVTNANDLSSANSLATGLTNDKAAVLEFTLDKAPTAGQEVKVYRYTLSESSDAANPYTTHGKTEVIGDMVASADGLTYTVTPKGDNVLSDTYSQNYRYEVVVRDKNGEDLSTGSKGTFNFRLDTLVEQMSVEKFDITTGEVIFAPTGLSEVGATIEYRYATGTGTSGWDTVTAGADGKYSLQLNNFNRKVPGALELRITDAAGNVSETKVSVLRNLFANMNKEIGPDPSKGYAIAQDGGFDDSVVTGLGNLRQLTENGDKGGFVTTDGNDTVIVGLDYQSFGSMGLHNGSFGASANDRFNFDAGAGDDSIQFRGTAQSMHNGKIAMGAGNDRVSIAGGLVTGIYTFDLGQKEDVAGNTNILYVGGNTANAATHNFYGGAGNDTIRIDGNFDGNKTVHLGEGNNELRVGYGTEGGVDLKMKIDFISGSGDDTISVKGSINTIAGQTQTFNLGDGDNFIEVGKDVDTDGIFTFGSGVDTVNIKDTLKGGIFTFGAGNDSLTVGSILKSAADNVKIDMGEGDDTITITGTRVNTGSGAINGGEGNDTIFLHGTDLSLDMSQVLNVETIDMRAVTGGTGNQKVALMLEDLQRSGDTITKLYIKGDAGDTVDFGNNDGNGNDNGARDGANGKEYRDSRGTNLTEKGNWNVWEKTGSDIVENGVVYDKYTYKGATGEVNNEEVYIQQGIQII